TTTSATSRSAASPPATFPSPRKGHARPRARCLPARGRGMLLWRARGWVARGDRPRPVRPTPRARRRAGCSIHALSGKPESDDADPAPTADTTTGANALSADPGSWKTAAGHPSGYGLKQVGEP